MFLSYHQLKHLNKKKGLEKMKKQLLINLIELRILLDLFLLDNNNITNKIKDVIINLMQLDKEKDFTKILQYDADQLKYFCNENINNLLKDF